MQRRPKISYTASVIIAAMILLVPSVGISKVIQASQLFPFDKMPEEFTINVPYKTQPSDMWPYKPILLKKFDAAYKALKALLVKEKSGWKIVPTKKGIEKNYSNIKDTYFYSSIMDVTCNSRAYNFKKGELVVEYALPKSDSKEQIDPKILKAMLWNSEFVQIVTLIKSIDACPDFFSLIHTEDKQ